MWIFFTVLCIIILLLILAVAGKYRTTLIYENGVFTIKVWQLIVYSTSGKRKKDRRRAKIPKLNYSDALKNIKAFKQFYLEEKDEITHIIKEAEERNVLIRLGLSITFGFTDAAITGIANGVIWGMITGIISYINKYVDIKDKTSIAVCPSYTKSCFDVSVSVVFDIRLIKMLYVVRRAKKLYRRYNAKFSEG